MFHLLIDMTNCDKQKLWNVSLISNFLKEMPAKINMNTLTEPIVIEDRKGSLEEQGITGFVILDESHLAIHTYPEKQCAFIDIFSCKEISEEKTEKFILRIFGSVDIRKKLLER